MASVPLKVTLLTLHDCHLCDQARGVIGRLGRERPVVVEETAWDSAEGQLLVQRDGIPFAPAVYIDGSFFAYGRISEGALRRRLGKRDGARRWLPWHRLP
ncbi:MAG: thioredoxin family protein [Chloroflexi bacterium]|nr:MAG: thioredoxin family protein [Chloroflexota bacterium]